MVKFICCGVWWVWILAVSTCNRQTAVEIWRIEVFPMKTSPRSLLLLGVLACVSFVIPAYAAPPTVITSLPFNITVPGKYILNQNLTTSVLGAAIAITSGDVTVDLNGYTITGPGGRFSRGIVVVNVSGLAGAVSNVKLQNGTLANFQFGIAFAFQTSNGFVAYGVADSIIRNITLSAIDTLAISDDFGTGNHIETCTIIPDANAQIGILLVGCTDDTISNNKFYPAPSASFVAAYQDIAIQATVEGNDVVNNKDVTP